MQTKNRFRARFLSRFFLLPTTIKKEIFFRCLKYAGIFFIDNIYKNSVHTVGRKERDSTEETLVLRIMLNSLHSRI